MIAANEDVREQFWLVNLGLSLLTLFFVSVPVIGSMACVSLWVQRQTTPKARRKALASCWITCHLMICLFACWAYYAWSHRFESSNLSLLFAIEFAFVSIMTDLAISISIILQYFGLSRGVNGERLPSDEHSSTQ